MSEGACGLSEDQGRRTCQEDILANRVAFYMDDAVLCDKRPYVFIVESSPAVFGRRPHRGSSRRRDGADSPELRGQTSVKRLSEVPARKRSLRRSCSVREGSRCPAERDKAVVGGSFRSQRVRRPAGPERQSSVRSCGGPKNSRKVSTLSERFELPHKDLPPKERRRRTVVLIVVSTFLFLVACSVLVVIVTLTQSTFHRHPLADNHSASPGVRKENEQLMNLNRDDLDDLYNTSVTTSPTPPGQSTPPD